MKHPPCIRGLKKFEKSGCPCRAWDGESGCPAWVELLVTPPNEPLKPKDKIGKCIDHWQIDFWLKSLGLLEGNQQAIESFRNNMTVDGSPKPDPAIILLANALSKLRIRRIEGGSQQAALPQDDKRED